MTERRRLLSHALRALLVLALAAGWLLVAAWRGGHFAPDPPPTPPQTPAPLTAGDVTVLDGDTFVVRGEHVRLLAVDCPERAAPWFDGDQEPWASRARDLARDAVRAATRVELLLAPEKDERGRRLGHLLLDGDPLAAKLAAAGLAHATVERWGDEGFPEIASEVLRRARRPSFEAPWRWRKKHRRAE